MRAVIQRVSASSVAIDGEVAGRIGKGLNVLLAVAPEDTEEDAVKLAEKIVNLRIFCDDAGKMNLSLGQVNGELLVVSQFTLYADCRRGNRPSFTGSAPPPHAERLYEFFVQTMRDRGFKTETGRFGAMMDVHIENEGPVTIILDMPQQKDGV